MAVKLIKSNEYQTSFYSKLVSESNIMFVSQELSKTITNLLGMPSTLRVGPRIAYFFLDNYYESISLDANQKSVNIL